MTSTTTAREHTARLLDLLCREQAAMADFLLALADLDRRRRWRTLGHASLFSFLRRELHLSAGAAQYRKTAAELVQRFPEVEAALRAGRLCLSSVVELAKVITRENAAELLPRFYGLSSRDAALVAASIRPVEHPPVREVVTVVRPSAATVPGAPSGDAPPSPRPSPPAPAGGEGAEQAGSGARNGERGPDSPSPPPPVVGVEPLDAERVRLHLTASRRFLAKLEATKQALSHARPGASTEEILDAGLDLLLAQHAKRRGLVERPRPAGRPSTSGAVPAAVSREVWRRAGGRCEWPLDGGGTCGSTLRLELDHVVPRAHGGEPTTANLRLVCRFHNDRAARLVFGDRWMDRFTGPMPRAPET